MICKLFYFKGVGAEKNDPFENYRKTKSYTYGRREFASLFTTFLPSLLTFLPSLLQESFYNVSSISSTRVFLQRFFHLFYKSLFTMFLPFFTMFLYHLFYKSCFNRCFNENFIHYIHLVFFNSYCFIQNTTNSQQFF